MLEKEHEGYHTKIEFVERFGVCSSHCMVDIAALEAS